MLPELVLYAIDYSSRLFLIILFLDTKRLVLQSAEKNMQRHPIVDIRLRKTSLNYNI
jgi:hypothetical protein